MGDRHFFEDKLSNSYHNFTSGCPIRYSGWPVGYSGWPVGYSG
jgi:hypothetical protein